MANLGFSFKQEAGTVVFYRRGKKIKQISGLEALKFLDSTYRESEENIQIQIAKLTGNYKRGNERFAKNHPRNKE